MSQERNTPERVPSYLFLKRLQELFPIKNIYYPGSGIDTKLEEAFSREQIVNVDNKMHDEFQRLAISSIESGQKPRTQITADFGLSPFKDEVFDALYFYDNHAGSKEFEEMLRTLKPGGLVIIGDTCFGSTSKIEVLKTTNLKRVKLPFRHDADASERLIVLQKQQSGECKSPAGFLESLEQTGISIGTTNELID